MLALTDISSPSDLRWGCQSHWILSVLRYSWYGKRSIFSTASIFCSIMRHDNEADSSHSMLAVSPLTTHFRTISKMFLDNTSEMLLKGQSGICLHNFPNCRPKKALICILTVSNLFFISLPQIKKSIGLWITFSAFFSISLLSWVQPIWVQVYFHLVIVISNHSYM